jgi:hypothetical protein
MFKQNKQRAGSKLFLNKKAIARLAMTPQFAKLIIGGGNDTASGNSSAGGGQTGDDVDLCTSRPTRPYKG